MSSTTAGCDFSTEAPFETDRELGLHPRRGRRFAQQGREEGLDAPVQVPARDVEHAHQCTCARPR